MVKHFRSILLLFISVLLVNGCASRDSTTNVEWQTHQQRLATINQYKANGKLGYISPEQRQSLYFHWSHLATQTKLRLTTFLGQTALNLTANPTGASVETYDGQTLYAARPEQLILQLTGIKMPLSQLNDWLLGKPSQADEYQLNQTHTLASLTKRINGQTWQLNYQSYQDVQLDGITLPLPKKIQFTQGDTVIKIVISKWIINP